MPATGTAGGFVKLTERTRVAFIEFDDQGDLRDRPQLEQVTQALIKRPKASPPLLLIVFAHGWQHDAGERDENLRDFGNMLQMFENGGARKPPGEGSDPAHPRTRWGGDILGVYLGWRGDALPLRSRPQGGQPLDFVQGSAASFFSVFTFGSRKEAALRVGRVSCTEAVLSTLSAAKLCWEYKKKKETSSPDVEPEPRGLPAEGAGETEKTLASREDNQVITVVAGHSFGGLIMERAFMQAMIGYGIINAPSEANYQQLATIGKAAAEKCQGDLDNVEKAIPDSDVRDYETFLDRTSKALALEQREAESKANLKAEKDAAGRMIQLATSFADGPIKFWGTHPTLAEALVFAASDVETFLGDCDRIDPAAAEIPKLKDEVEEIYKAAKLLAWSITQCVECDPKKLVKGDGEQTAKIAEVLKIVAPKDIFRLSTAPVQDVASTPEENATLISRIMRVRPTVPGTNIRGKDMNGKKPAALGPALAILVPLLRECRIRFAGVYDSEFIGPSENPRDGILTHLEGVREAEGKIDQKVARALKTAQEEATSAYEEWVKADHELTDLKAQREPLALKRRTAADLADTIRKSHQKPPADLLLLLNPAADAVMTKQMQDFWKEPDDPNDRSRDWITRLWRDPDAKEAKNRGPGWFPRPWVVSISSSGYAGDWVTERAFPWGMRLPRVVGGGGAWSLKAKDEAQCKRMIQTAPHVAELRTHRMIKLGTNWEPGETSVWPLEAEVGKGKVTQFEQFELVTTKPGSLYWVVDVPSAVIPGHGGIFNPAVYALAAKIIETTRDEKNMAAPPAQKKSATPSTPPQAGQ